MSVPPRTGEKTQGRGQAREAGMQPQAQQRLGHQELEVAGRILP